MLDESVMSLDLLIEIKDNLHKNQKARNELYDLLVKAYYVDSIKYKIDDTTIYLQSSSEWIVYDSQFHVIVIIL